MSGKPDRQSQIDSLKHLAFLHSRKSKWEPWLPARPSEAFLCCIGAGPWRFNRRQQIQGRALERLGSRDLCRLADGVFPLDWQNARVRAMKDYIAVTNFDSLVDCGHFDRKKFYRACGVVNGTKVLSLFVRDFLEQPAFPVDRHVRRELQRERLPTDEDSLLALCEEAKVDAVTLARQMGTQNLDNGNPSWASWTGLAYELHRESL